MSKTVNFENLICWKKSRIFVKEIYDITSGHLFCKDYALNDQVRRASLSVMLNIAESHGSIAETQSCLYVAYD